MDDTDLKKIESKVWTSYFKDGLWDIFFGLMLLTMGLRTLTDNVLFTFGMLAAVLVHILGKRWITVPRLGVVRFSETRRKKRSFLIYLIGGTVLVTAVIMTALMKSRGSLNELASAAVFGTLFLVVFGAMAYVMNYPRLMLYGLIFFVVVALNETIGDFTAAILSTVAGGVITIFGIIILAVFIRRNPVLQESGETQDEA